MKFLLYVAAIIGLASGACFDNGDKEIQGMCFKLVPQMLTYQDARDWCHYKNPVTSSNLAYVPNQFTANFLACKLEILVWKLWNYYRFAEKKIDTFRTI